MIFFNLGNMFTAKLTSERLLLSVLRSSPMRETIFLKHGNRQMSSPSWVAYTSGIFFTIAEYLRNTVWFNTDQRLNQPLTWAALHCITPDS